MVFKVTLVSVFTFSFLLLSPRVQAHFLLISEPQEDRHGQEADTELPGNVSEFSCSLHLTSDTKSRVGFKKGTLLTTAGGQTAGMLAGMQR